MIKDLGDQNRTQRLGGQDDKQQWNEVIRYFLFYLLFCVLIGQQTVNRPPDESCFSKRQIGL